MNISRIISSLMLSMCFFVALISCDGHVEEEDTSLRVGQILCTDGTVLTREQVEAQGKEAVAVVFYVNQGENRALSSGCGLAAYLCDVDAQAFSDSIGVSQGTSTDFEACDGNSNTYILFNNKNVTSEMAETVFHLWPGGRSCYVPSVGEMRLMYMNRSVIDKYSQMFGGTPLSKAGSEALYWTSTEVAGQAEAKAWVYSMGSGNVQEAPKTQTYKIRPIVTLYN